MLPKIIHDFQTLTLPDSIKTVLLDLDNTCYKYEPCHDKALSKTRQVIESIVGQLPNFAGLYSQAQKQTKERIPTLAASHSRILYFQALFEILGRSDGHLHAPRLEEIYWEAFMSVMEKTIGLDDFLANSRRSGKTIVVVSDLTATIQCQKLLALHLEDKIDFLVTAEEVGAEKPDAKPFLVALEKAGSGADAAVMIGDNYERDIVGAENLGIDGILITHDTSTQKTSLRQGGGI